MGLHGTRGGSVGLHGTRGGSVGLHGTRGRSVGLHGTRGGSDVGSMLGFVPSDNSINCLLASISGIALSNVFELTMPLDVETI